MEDEPKLSPFQEEEFRYGQLILNRMHTVEQMQYFWRVVGRSNQMWPGPPIENLPDED